MINNSIKEKITPEVFITRYKAAHAVGLSRQQFADIMDITPATVVRRRLTVKKEFGVDLPQLKTNTSPIETEQLVEYNKKLEELLKKLSKPSTTGEKFIGKNRFVITSAQNATPPHMEFLACIKNYCEHNDAEFIVVPTRYYNLKSVYSTSKRSDEWWHPSLQPFLFENRARLSKNLVLLGNLKIKPATSEPLTSLESYSGMDSAIIGHPKIQLKTVATPAQSLPKLFTTTGSVTIANYSDSKEGYKGEFHHSIAALIVEIDEDGDFHMRHIHADNSTGCFYDLNKFYTTNSVETVDRIAALVTGDTHAEFVDQTVKEATYTGADSIVKVLKPEVMVFHDVEDFYARNHHHRNNDLQTFGKHHFGRNNVEESLQITADFIDEVGNDDTLNVIVKSNHDEAFDRWLREADPKADPENAAFYHYMKFNQYRSIRKTATGFSSIDPFEFWCHNPLDQTGLKYPERTHFLKRDEPFRVANIELGFHGDKGPDGTRGSVKSFAKIGPKTIIGHRHSPSIYEGCYQVGVSAMLDLEYVSGCSSWMHTHAIIYPDGSRTLIHLVNGKWRA